MIAIPPGATIKEQLEIESISIEEFSEHMNLSSTETEELLSGETVITSDTASKLEDVLGVPADFWLNLESIYRRKLL